jgi:polyisoprenoid-binding protein YceI
LENIDGGTAIVTGSFALDLGNLEATTGKVLVAVNTMQTGIALRDRHLQEKDWLDGESFPNITFDIKKLSSVQIVSSGGGKGVAKAIAEGAFSLHGVSKSMSVSIEITYVEKSPNDLVMIKVNDFPVSLKDHGVTGRKGIVGSKVSETITIKAMLYGSTN